MLVRILVTAVTCATLGAAAMFIGNNAGPRELAIDAIDRLAQRTELSGNVHLHSTRVGDVGRSIDFDRNGPLAAASDDPAAMFAAVTDGRRTVVQTTRAGKSAPADPAPVVRDLNRLLDLARLKRAAAVADWTAAADGTLRARLDPAQFGDLGDADAVKAVNATLITTDRAATRLVLTVVHAAGTGATGGDPAESEWTTTASFRFTEQPAPSAIDARTALSGRLKKADIEEPTSGRHAVPAARTPSPATVADDASGKAAK